MADLVQKLRDEECRREAQFMRSPMMNPPMKFTHDEPMRALLGQAATELEALRKRCEAVEALVPLWRDEGIRLNGGADKPYTDAENSVRALTLDCCADDLVQAIAAAQEPSHG